MSNTRRASTGAGYRVERYMSNPVYAAGRALPLSVVADKAELQGDERKRRLLYFLQMRSIEPGGLRKVADEFLEQFKWRFGTPAMRGFGCKPGMVLSANQVRTIRDELPKRYDFDDLIKPDAAMIVLGGGNPPVENWRPDFALPGDTALPHPDSYDQLAARYFNAHDRLPRVSEAEYRRIYQARLTASKAFPSTYPAEAFCEQCLPSRAELEGALVEMCVNPMAILAFHNEPDQAAAEYEERVRIFCEPEEPDQVAAPDRDKCFRHVRLQYLPDFIDALVEFQRGWAATTPVGFVDTSISRQVFADITHAERTKRIVLVQLNEGSGKSVAAEAYCRQASGQARLVKLSGITHKSGFFQAIAKSLGVGLGSGLSATRLQNKVESVLQKTRLTLLIDEAHNLFSPTDRVRTRPELFDWVYSAATDQKVPVVMLCTPAFSARLRRTEAQVDTWNSRQFKRRVTRATAYPERPSEDDFAKVAAAFFPALTAKQVRLVVGYALGSERRLSAIQDVYEDALSVALAAGRSAPVFADIEQALREYRIPTDTMLRTITEPPKSPKRGGRRLALPRQDGFNPDADDLQRADADEDFPAPGGRLAPDYSRRETLVV